MLEHR